MLLRVGSMKNEGVTTFKVAAVYIGTIVGAGFATGQEVLQFFNRFGIWGLGGLAVATILFIVSGISSWTWAGCSMPDPIWRLSGTPGEISWARLSTL